jgi:hypothetical protein
MPDAPKVHLPLEVLIEATRKRVQESKTIWGAYYISMWVLAKFLGMKWMEANLMNRISSTDYLRTAPQDDFSNDLHMNRVIHLGELFFNLQAVPGVMTRFKAIKDDPKKLQDLVTELMAAKLFLLYRLPFRFVPPQGMKTLDYDLELLLPDKTKVCCDAKCKLESSELGLNTLKNSLKQARTQLPKDECGMVVVSTSQ